VRLLTTKNGDQRDVPLNTAAVEALKALDWNAEAAYDHRPFYNTIGEMRDRLFNRDRSVVFHVTRSTALTNMAERGINPYMMSKFVGHRDIQTTLRYVKGKQSALAKIADELLD
jgi:integrase